MLVTELILLTMVSAVELSNVRLLIKRAPDGHVSERNPVNPNARVPIFVAELISILVSAEQPENASIPIVVTELMPVMLVHT